MKETRHGLPLNELTILPGDKVRVTWTNYIPAENIKVDDVFDVEYIRGGWFLKIGDLQMFPHGDRCLFSLVPKDTTHA